MQAFYGFRKSKQEELSFCGGCSGRWAIVLSWDLLLHREASKEKTETSLPCAFVPQGGRDAAELLTLSRRASQHSRLLFLWLRFFQRNQHARMGPLPSKSSSPSQSHTGHGFSHRGGPQGRLPTPSWSWCTPEPPDSPPSGGRPQFHPPDTVTPLPALLHVRP